MNKRSIYVVIRNDGSARVALKPRVANDEVAIKLNISWPPGWGQTIHELDVEMPDPPGVTAVRDLQAIKDSLE